MTTFESAQGALSQLLVKKQSALGTAATGNYLKVRYNTHSFNAQKSSVESGEIRGDREVSDVRHGNRHVTGDLSYELLFGGHDDFTESAMFDDFATLTSDTQIIRIGTSANYLSIEDGATDISKYRLFQDMLCSRMTWHFRTNAMVTVDSSWVGASGGTPAPTSGGGTPTGPNTTSPFDTFSGAVYEGLGSTDTIMTGAELANITSCNITVDNGVAPSFALGQQTAVALERGRGRVSGTVTLYYNDTRWLDSFLDEEEKVLIIQAFDPQGNEIRWRMDRVKFMSGDVPVDREQSRIITMNFIALKDKVLTPATALAIYKNPV